MKKLLAYLSKKDRVLLYISLAVKIAIFLVFVTSIVKLRILTAVLALIALIISFIPAMIKRTYKIVLPPEFEVTFALFLYATFILGELKDFYTLLPWWDVLLHVFSAAMIALIGFMIVYSFYFVHRVVFSPLFAAIFSFSFALALGGLWEIFEFGMDQFFFLNMQKSGLLDTMWDLIFDAVAALVVSIIGFFYLKGGDSFLMEKFVKKFVKLNEKILQGK